MPAQPRSRTVGCFVALVILTVIAGITYTVWYRSRAASRGRLSRDQAYVMLRSDLDHLGTAEAAYFAERASFSANLDSLQFILIPTTQIRFTRIDSTGWSAILTDTRTHASCSGGATAQDPLRRIDPLCD